MRFKKRGFRRRREEEKEEIFRDGSRVSSASGYDRRCLSEKMKADGTEAVENDHFEAAAF